MDSEISSDSPAKEDKKKNIQSLYSEQNHNKKGKFEKRKSRREVIEQNILDKYHQSQHLQSILKPKTEDKDEEVNEIKPKFEISDSDKQEVDLLLGNLDKIRKEQKKKLIKEKKKYRQQQKLLKEAEETKETKQEKAIAYLKQWKKHRDEWKFRKNMHIWLLKNWKHSNKLPDKRFKTFLKYLKSNEQKSFALQRLEQEAQKIVDNTEDKEQNIHSYDRARDILQWIAV